MVPRHYHYTLRSTADLEVQLSNTDYGLLSIIKVVPLESNHVYWVEFGQEAKRHPLQLGELSFSCWPEKPFLVVGIGLVNIRSVYSLTPITRSHVYRTHLCRKCHLNPALRSWSIQY